MEMQQTDHTDGFFEQIENLRLITSQNSDEARKIEFSQFFTSAAISRFMASLFQDFDNPLSVLDPGAGIGNLSAAFVERAINENDRIQSLNLTCYEIDSELIKTLQNTLNICKKHSLDKEINLSFNIRLKDFIHDGARIIKEGDGLFPSEIEKYSHCIMNPPYKKINSNSQYRRDLSSIGIETSNLYTGFLAISILLLQDEGEIVAIIPRSFCNGVYFKGFRNFLLKNISIKQIHVFNQRNKNFKDDDVLQENVIIYGKKGGIQDRVKITSSDDSSLAGLTETILPADKVINPNDHEKVIHIATNDYDQMVVESMSVFTHTLHDLGINVSTGPIVDFRLKDHICHQPQDDTYPLIYPSHIEMGNVHWPKLNGKKANSIKLTDKSRHYLMRNGWYVLTRRFSSKEEKRRIYASVYNPQVSDKEYIGFENHLNVFHKNKSGLDKYLAYGLKTYLNCTIVDQYFRQFSGHTQVNASDLRNIKYPSLEELKELGEKSLNTYQTQKDIDNLIQSIINKKTPMKKKSTSNIKQKIDEALDIIKTLDLPKA